MRGVPRSLARPRNAAIDSKITRTPAAPPLSPVYYQLRLISFRPCCCHSSALEPAPRLLEGLQPMVSVRRALHGGMIAYEEDSMVAPAR